MAEDAHPEINTENVEGEKQDGENADTAPVKEDFVLQEVVAVRSSNLFLNPASDGGEEEGEGEYEEISEGEMGEGEMEQEEGMEATGEGDVAGYDEEGAKEVEEEVKDEAETQKGGDEVVDELDIEGEEAEGGLGYEEEGEDEGEYEDEGEGEQEILVDEEDRETVIEKVERDQLDMQYRESHRYETEHRRISGDFAMKPASDMFIRRDTYEPTLEEDEGESESDKSLSATIQIEEPQIIDRTPYLKLYVDLMADYPVLKVKNNFLQTKMADYFKRRKMEHVLRESERTGDAQEKYSSKLERFWELRNMNNIQRGTISSEVDEMKTIRNKQITSVTENFKGMQNRERDIGTGLIFTKTAKEIPEKFLERLLKNQRTKSKEIEDMRFKYIKIRNNIAEITEAIKAMDKIGTQYTLMDFEQLKMENQGHSDKIEERDDELFKLRTKCSAATQCLAHLREKSSYVDIAILEMCDKLDEIELEKNEGREQVNYLKSERDSIRAKTVKLRNESGLLTKTTLLIDMENTLQDIEMVTREITDYQTAHIQTSLSLKALKRNIADEEHNYHPPKRGSTKKKEERSHKICREHPTFAYPSLEKFRITRFGK